MRHQLLLAVFITTAALMLVACGQRDLPVIVPEVCEGEGSLCRIAELFTTIGSWAMGLSVLGFVAMLVLGRNPVVMAYAAGSGWLCLVIAYIFKFMAEYFWPLSIAAILTTGTVYVIAHRKGWLWIKARDLADDGKLNGSVDMLNTDHIETERIEKGQ